MRLIKTDSLELFEFPGNVPPYAILSHTWGPGEEVMLSDMATKEARSEAALQKKSGFDKIVKTCNRAREDGYSWAWVDTCCIDKTSSAELTEAINSMFRWYQGAAVCYAYIADLDLEPKKPRRRMTMASSTTTTTNRGEGGGGGGEEDHGDGSGSIRSKQDNNDNHEEEEEEEDKKDDEPSPQPQEQQGHGSDYKDAELALGLRNSRWMTRGWTLQELIAPRKVQFFDSGWRLRGDKEALRGLLSDITGIDVDTLRFGRLRVVPVARRMSWASGRQTTRVEDMAYCLLGIFDVNMPMLYGEGAKAFVRLQHEIMRATNDLSLFAWKSDGLYFVDSSSRTDDGRRDSGGRGNGTVNYGSRSSASSRALAVGPSRHVSILAESPVQFASCRNLRWTSDPRFNGEFSLTNMGLRMPNLLKVLPRSEPRSECYVLPLNCCYHVAASQKQKQQPPPPPPPQEQGKKSGGGLDGGGYEQQSLGVYLVQYGPSLFARRDDTSLCVMPKQDPHPFGFPKTPDVASPLYINTSPINPQQSLSIARAREGAIRLSLPWSWVHNHLTVKAEPHALWDPHHQLFLAQVGMGGRDHGSGGMLGVADEMSFFRGRWTVYLPRSEPGEDMSELQILVGRYPRKEDVVAGSSVGHDHDHYEQGGGSNDSKDHEKSEHQHQQQHKYSHLWVSVMDFSKESLARLGRQRRDHISLELAEARAAQANFPRRATSIWGKNEVEIWVSGQYEEYRDRPRDKNWGGDGGGAGGGLSWNVFTVAVAVRVIGERKNERHRWVPSEPKKTQPGS